MKFFQHLTTVQGRIATGCALVAAVVLGLWPVDPRPVDPAKTVAVILAALAWLFAEIAGHRAPSEHDTALFSNLTETVPQRLLDFLRDQDFGVGLYVDPGTGGLHDVAYWQGSRYEFVDPVLNRRWLAVRKNLREFTNTLALNTFPVHGSQDLRTVHPTQGDPEDPAPFVQARIDKLNEGATKLAAQIDAFESFARHRLGI
jgi:hypothetical protein